MAPDALEVFEIGSAVVLDGDIPATVTALSIRGVEHYLSYEVTWWDERDRKSDWVTPGEVKAGEACKTRTLRFLKAS